uniref:Palmitoyltransferase n=1 Tax=Nothobranchius kadleci TaxID=1051664 RepID=A0A1A8DJ71_NOTKA
MRCSVLHLLRCVRLRLCSRRGRSRLPLWAQRIQAYIKLLAQSLCFNSLTDSDVVFDSIFEPVFVTVDYVTRWFGMVFVCLVVILTSSVVMITYIVLLPLALTTYSPAWIAWHSLYGNWNLIMIAFHYYKAIKTSPGYPPSEKNDRPFVSVCKKCIMPKPARTHHCGICNRCILKMDHHCPWVNNCVGFSNYKFFVLFLAYATLYCVVICATVVQYFIKFWTKELPDTHAKFHILFLFFVAALFFISIVSLFSYHLWLVGKNRTTIEAFRAPVFANGPDKNGFSLGFKRNLVEVFGDQAKNWIFPVFSSQGDGHSFVTRLVHIDPEQANSILQQNGKIPANGEPNPCVLVNSAPHTEDSSKETADASQTVAVTMDSEP